MSCSAEDVTKTFCAKNGIAMVVRSHQSKKDGIGAGHILLASVILATSHTAFSLSKWAALELVVQWLAVG